jgi:hypothetical protein
MLGQLIAETTACQIRHHKIGKSVLFTVLIDGHNVHVVKPGDEIGFAPKTNQKLLLRCHAWTQYLDSYAAYRSCLLRQVNSAHTAGANQLSEYTRPQNSSDELLTGALHNSISRS